MHVRGQCTAYLFSHLNLLSQIFALYHYIDITHTDKTHNRWEGGCGFDSWNILCMYHYLARRVLVVARTRTWFNNNLNFAHDKQLQLCFLYILSPYYLASGKTWVGNKDSTCQSPAVILIYYKEQKDRCSEFRNDFTVSRKMSSPPLSMT